MKSRTWGGSRWARGCPGSSAGIWARTTLRSQGSTSRVQPEQARPRGGWWGRVGVRTGLCSSHLWKGWERMLQAALGASAARVGLGTPQSPGVDCKLPPAARGSEERSTWPTEPRGFCDPEALGDHHVQPSPKATTSPCPPVPHGF